jgi:serpin B
MQRLMSSLLTELPIDENVVCSPLSVRTVLAMLLPGARGDTREQLERFVGTDEPADLATLLDSFRPDRDGAIRLSVANGAFLQPGFPVLPSYSEAIEGPFRAQIENLDFGHPIAAAARINEWVEKATEGMISNLLSPQTIERLTSLVLVNAIYFLAAWENPFEENYTQPERFHPLKGAAYDIPMMGQRCFLPYVADKRRGLEAVRIPYKATSLVVVLPRRGRFEEVARSFGEDRVAGLRLSEREVELRLPRFEIESRLSLQDVLSQLGVRVPFDRNHADFGDLTDHPDGLFVGAVEHAARIRVDEQGTEAAAATAVTMVGAARNAPRPLEFHVDRPFLFFVYDDKSDNVLFAGRCTSPKRMTQDATVTEAAPTESKIPESGAAARESGRSRLRDFLARFRPHSRGR